MEEVSASITTYDVARAARVSIGTVNRVLNNQPNVDEVLRKRVLEAIQELGYVYVPKKRQASNTREQNRIENDVKSIMICFPPKYSPEQQNSAVLEAYYYRVLRGAERDCASRDVHLIYNTLPDETQEALYQIKTALERNIVDGLIMVNCGTPRLVREIIQLQIPLIVVEPNEPQHFPVDLVMNDDFEGGRLATQHLLELGHRDIALLTCLNLGYTARRRMAGYHTALLDANLLPRAEYVIDCESADPDECEQSLRKFIKQGSHFSAIACFNDNTAIGAIRACQSVGLSVPEDVSIIGFDDLDVATLSSPPLTTIQGNTEGKGVIAMQRLLDKIAHPSGILTWSVLPVSLVKRASTAVAPKWLPEQ